MAEKVNISQIKVGNEIHEISAKYWGDLETTDFNNLKNCVEQIPTDYVKSYENYDCVYETYIKREDDDNYGRNIEITSKDDTGNEGSVVVGSRDINFSIIGDNCGVDLQLGEYSIDINIGGGETRCHIKANTGGLFIDEEPVATVDYVNNLVKGGVKFRGVVTELPWVEPIYIGVEEYENMSSADLEHALKGYEVGDIIIVAATEGDYMDEPKPDSTETPSIEYILVKEYGGILEGASEHYRYRWEDLGDISPAQEMIEDYLDNIAISNDDVTSIVNTYFNLSVGYGSGNGISMSLEDESNAPEENVIE